MTRKKKIVLAVGACACIGLLAFFFGRPNNGKSIEYMTEEARVGKIARVVSATGEVGAVQLVTVGAQVSGQIKKLHVVVGQRVSKGDLIAELDDVPQVNQLETDRALLESYQAQLESKTVTLRMAEAQYLREKKLRAKDAASKESLENLEDAYALAKAEVAVVESQIRQTQLSVNTDEVNLGYTRITAPLDGVVVSVPVDEGQTVNSNQTTPTIAQIADLKDMEIKIEISEGDITAVQPGMNIAYTILSEPDNVQHAQLTSIDPGLTTLTDGTYKSDSSSSSSSSSEAVYYYGKALIDNSDGRLRIGMTVQVDVDVASAENAVLAPLLSVSKGRDGESIVRVLGSDGAPHIRKVQTGINDGVNIHIIEGLEAGEKVITNQLSQADIAKMGSRRVRGMF